MAHSIPAAIAELRAHAGTQFCPLALDALESIWRERPEILVGTARHLHAVVA
jgi:HD-GYP domain-containing protein (c-di-GMP phosphodiesterase class II)